MKYIISISDFNEIVNGIKGMKADLVKVSGKFLYGTDNGCITLKTYNMNNQVPVEDFTIITKTLSKEFFNNLTDVNVVIDTDINKIYCPNNESYAENLPQMIDNSFNNTIQGIVDRLNHTIALNCNTIVDIGDITNDEGFLKLREIKAADGAILYNPDNVYGMYLYSGALPVTKSDKVYLKVYDTGNTFISNFSIIKKKLNPINVYFNFVKLNNMCRG